MDPTDPECPLSAPNKNLTQVRLDSQTRLIEIYQTRKTEKKKYKIPSEEINRKNKIPIEFSSIFLFLDLYFFLFVNVTDS